nr:RNA-directed DNA polymerase, eukaryota, reverse transcriptase zinc-binding domain protein [Tanacetum cinerariifolium]
MGFDSKWCGWIRACLESTTSSVLVNGSPTKKFALERGIRQGDHLSPFLFLIVAESLNVAMQEVVQGGLFDGVKVGEDGIEVSHLQYANDTIFVGDWNRRNIISLMKLLKCFQMASGLKVNLNKSTLFGIGVEMEEVEGRATSLRECEERCFWGGGNGESKSVAWIKWKKVISSYGVGGLNIGSLKAMNWALLAKWWWRFRFERDAFWVKVIKSLYGEGGGTVGQSLSGSGNAIMFWEDNWIGMGKLRDLFSRLYHLDVVNDAILGNKGFWREDKWVWNWVWRSDLRGRAVTDMHNLSNLVQDIQLKKIPGTSASGGLMMVKQVVFKGNESKILDLFKEVQERAFEWIAARMKKDHLKWED